jgi:hypothetical protein
VPGNELIRWHRQRCGDSEQAHAVLKDDLAGGRLPSQYFGANAAWWQIVILAYNLQVLMQRQLLGGSWATKRLKAVRFAIINLAGRVVYHARRLSIRLPAAHQNYSGEALSSSAAKGACQAGSPCYRTTSPAGLPLSRNYSGEALSNPLTAAKSAVGHRTGPSAGYHQEVLSHSGHIATR